MESGWNDYAGVRVDAQHNNKSDFSMADFTLLPPARMMHDLLMHIIFLQIQILYGRMAN